MPTRDERNRLIVENLPLVGYLASETHARATHVPREELVSAGALALVTAADAFDPELGVPFGAYARRRILGAFADEMRSMDWAPRGVRSRIKETTRVQETLSTALGRQASTVEIAATMGVSATEVSAALADASRTVTTIDEACEADLASLTPLPEESAIVAERRELLQHAIQALPERMRAIVQAVYIEERPVKEIAEELGVSHSAVSQQRAEAIRLLRDALEQYYRDGQEASVTSRVSASVREGFLARIAEAGGSRVARALSPVGVAVT
ncbi:sigma-70 family RNA polymerase sigma factor [Microbacterium sp. ARD32]|uniref:sigma-70 family RNA polymerase sigma factor n=1 Tax=Microbacterium sp. ARD32 TaxID=2962577 RepID=UPI002882C264|nr:sigma-70 family RNA polymerase sigma factor [Microbacterium sp. ARD32]MDT0156381.1 sigma-70 family RNA polymerase sigma factor [Microbacterium sp. ARD32]